MIPIRNRWNRTGRVAASPGATHVVRVVAGCTAAAAGSGKPRAAVRDGARNLADCRRIVDVLRRMLLAVAAACLLGVSTAIAADTGSPAQDLVKHVTSRIIEELESEHESLQENPERIYELADRLVLPYFDFERMARRVLGKRWKAATPEQQTRFVSAFRTLLVRTYAIVLNEYRGQTLTYLEPVTRKKDDEIDVPVLIDLTGSQTVRVAYAMHGSGSDWKVFDVVIDGVSLVTNYRSSFRSEVARHGIEGLIARIESKNSTTN